MEFHPTAGKPPSPLQYRRQQQAAPPPQSGYGYFTEKATRGYRKPQFGLGNDYFSQGIRHTNEYFGEGIEQANEDFRIANNVHQEIQRDLEKERIKDEIIAADIARRLVLEAEVRAELRMERELALRVRGGNAFDRFSYPMEAGVTLEPRGISFPQDAKGRPLEERIALYVEERLRMRARCETQGSDLVPFQRRSVGSEFKEALPSHSESGKQKVKIVFLAKPGGNLSGTKAKDVSQAKGSANKLFGVKNKNGKKEWICLTCQVSTTNEHDLNAHFQGKKHKSEEAALKATGNGCKTGFGVLPKKTVKPNVEVSGVSSPLQGLKLGGEALQINPSEPSSLHIVSTKCSDENNVSMLPENEKKDKLMKERCVSRPLQGLKLGGEVLQINQNEPSLLQIVSTKCLDEISVSMLHEDEKKGNLSGTKAKPGGNLSGTKAKDVSQAKGSANKLFGVKNKNGKKEWICLICQVSTTSEHDLSAHFQGKKHKSEEAALKATANGCKTGFGVLPQKTVKPNVEVSGVSSPLQGLKLGGEALQINPSEPSSLRIVSTKCSDENNVSMLPENEKKDKLMKERCVSRPLQGLKLGGEVLQINQNEPSLLHIVSTKCLDEISVSMLHEDEKKGNLSETKAKDVSQAKGSANKLFVVKNKNEKKEWICLICQVSTNSECVLNAHFQGKKHKSKEAALKATGNGCKTGFGVLPKKTVKPNVEVSGVSSPLQGLKLGGEALQINPSEPSSLHIVSTKCLDENNVSMLPENEKKDKLMKERWVSKPLQGLKLGGEVPKMNQNEPSLLHIVSTKCLDETSVSMLHEDEKKDKLTEECCVSGLLPGLKSGREALQINQSEPSSMHIVSAKCFDENGVSMLPEDEKKDKLTEKKSVGVQRAAKSKPKLKKNFTFWCDMCQVGSDYEEVMEPHWKGKKHVKQLQKTREIGQKLI